MDKNLENIIHKVAVKNSVTPKALKLAVDIFFKNAKGLVQRDDMPTIMMHGLGKIEPDERKIRARILLIKKYYLANAISEEQYILERDQLLAVLETIKSNKQYRTK